MSFSDQNRPLLYGVRSERRCDEAPGQHADQQPPGVVPLNNYRISGQVRPDFWQLFLWWDSWSLAGKALAQPEQNPPYWLTCYTFKYKLKSVAAGLRGWWWYEMQKGFAVVTTVHLTLGRLLGQLSSEPLWGCSLFLLQTVKPCPRGNFPCRSPNHLRRMSVSHCPALCIGSSGGELDWWMQQQSEFAKAELGLIRNGVFNFSQDTIIASCWMWFRDYRNFFR